LNDFGIALNPNPSPRKEEKSNILATNKEKWYDPPDSEK